MKWSFKFWITWQYFSIPKHLEFECGLISDEDRNIWRRRGFGYDSSFWDTCSWWDETIWKTDSSVGTKATRTSDALSFLFEPMFLFGEGSIPFVTNYLGVVDVIVCVVLLLLSTRFVVWWWTWKSPKHGARVRRQTLFFERTVPASIRATDR
jgi:hypothetical protein